MVGIEKIGSCTGSLIAREASKVSFRGAPALVATVEEAIPQVIQPDKIANFFKWFATYQGEVTNILINALGTAFVAPVVIAYNPIAKEDQNTKYYSALRQPISAVLAVLTQVGINIPFQKQMRKMAMEGVLGDKYHINPEALKNSRIDKEAIDICENLQRLGKAEIQASDGIIKQLIDQTEHLKKLNPEAVLEKLKKFSEPLQSSTKEAINDTIKLLETRDKRFKAFGTIAGAVLSLATLLPTSCALNWLYPRIVGKAFPELISTKKAGEAK